MKTVASFSKPEEAHLLRAHLEGSGIAAFVRDDHTVTADWALSNAIGGVRVEVAEEGYDDACFIIAAFKPSREPEEGGKNKHEFGRYMKLFLGVFIAVYAFLVWRLYPAPAHIYVIFSLISIMLAGCIAGIGALFDL